MFLTFERFNAEAGNAPGVVVYHPDRALLEFRQKFYRISENIPAGSNVRIYMRDSKLLNVYHKPDSDSPTVFSLCPVTMLPTDKQKLELTVLFQKHGRAMAAEVKNVLESVERLKTLVDTHEQELDAVYPGVDVDCLEIDSDCDFCTGVCEMESIEKLEHRARDMLTKARCLASAEPFADHKRRKVSDE